MYTKKLNLFAISLLQHRAMQILRNFKVANYRANWKKFPFNFRFFILFFTYSYAGVRIC